MNTIATARLTHAVMLAAALAAMFIVGSAHAAPADTTTVVRLPRVVVTGQRAAAAQPAKAVQLPRVVVSGRRVDNSRDAPQARRDEAVKPAVVLVAQR